MQGLTRTVAFSLFNHALIISCSSEHIWQVKLWWTSSSTCLWTDWSNGDKPTNNNSTLCWRDGGSLTCVYVCIWHQCWSVMWSNQSIYREKICGFFLMTYSANLFSFWVFTENKRTGWFLSACRLQSAPRGVSPSLSTATRSHVRFPLEHSKQGWGERCTWTH